MKGKTNTHSLKPWLIAPWFWLVLFVGLPLLVVLKISFSYQATARPPYKPVFEFWGGIQQWLAAMQEFSFENYVTLFEDTLLINSWLSSIKFAGLGTLLTLIIALPFAKAMAKLPESRRLIILMLVLIPFWTSFLIRIYALMALIKPEGLLNAVLMALGVIASPLAILNSDAAVVLGIAYAYLPFMVLPLFAAFEKLDPALPEAAADLGASPLQIFWRVTMPALKPALIAGCALVFIPAMGEVIVPDLLGRSDTMMIGKSLWNAFFANRDWPLAAAMAIVLLLTLLLPILFMSRQRALEEGL